MRSLIITLLAALSVAGCVTINRLPPAAAPATAPATQSPSVTPTGTPSPTPRATEAPSTQTPATQTPATQATPSATPTDVATLPLVDTPECQDDAYTLTGDHWDAPLEWYFNASSTPDYLDQADVLAVIERSFDNITGARNDCGLPDLVTAEAVYMGTTDNVPCGRFSDGQNVVGFKRLSGDELAITCPFGDRFGPATEVDIAIDTRTEWLLSPPCEFEYLLEPVVTHEIGHAFGLDHVSQRRHAALTMSPRGDPCDDSEFNPRPGRHPWPRGALPRSRPLTASLSRRAAMRRAPVACAWRRYPDARLERRSRRV